MKNLLECTQPFSNKTIPFKGLPEVSVNLILTRLVSFSGGRVGETVVVVVIGVLVGDKVVGVGEMEVVVVVSFTSSTEVRQPIRENNKAKNTINSMELFRNILLPESY